MESIEKLLKRDLPKWPQCIVTGTTISEKDALEIIRRTDIAFHGYSLCGNNKEYESWIRTTLHIPTWPIECNDMEHIKRCQEADREWADKWGVVVLQYLYNDWVASSCGFGCNGWCHPDGTIGYFYNIGKWPECIEVYNELCLIASLWTFLELEVTVMNQEYFEEELPIEPVISFLVRGGHVTVVDPNERNLHEEFNRRIPPREEIEELDKGVFDDLINKGYCTKISRKTIAGWSKYIEE